MRHLISIEDSLQPMEVMALLDHARQLRDGGVIEPLLADSTIALLFFEPSTRTQVSFDLAARRLGATTVNLSIAHSSTSKGETLTDTLQTLQSMDVDGFVLRHGEVGAPLVAARAVGQRSFIVNAGDGSHAHPTQGLLDAMTIQDHFDDLGALRVVICGDIIHSRVARSDIAVLNQLCVGQLHICGPQALLPETDMALGATRHDDFDEALEDADVVIMLRMQKERMDAASIPETSGYREKFGLTERRLERLKPGCIILHPGPANREVEIDSAVMASAACKMREQVRNGVFLRMAVLAACGASGASD